MIKKILILLTVILVMLTMVAFADGNPSPTPAPTSDIASVDMNIMNTIPWWVWTVVVAIAAVLSALVKFLREKFSKKGKD